MNPLPFQVGKNLFTKLFKKSMLLLESVRRRPVETDRDILTERVGQNKSHTLRPVKDTSFFKKLNLKEVLCGTRITLSVLFIITRSAGLWPSSQPPYIAVNWYIQPLLLYMVNKFKKFLNVGHYIFYQSLYKFWHYFYLTFLTLCLFAFRIKIHPVLISNRILECANQSLLALNGLPCALSQRQNLSPDPKDIPETYWQNTTLE